MHILRPLISVIMPVHNAQAFVIPAIESILTQTYPNIELIIIDDASTDNTSRLLATQTDPRIKIIHRQECGCSGVLARNDGLKIAQGAFIAVADADDISLPQRLEKQITYLQNNPHIDLLGGGMQEIDTNNTPCGEPIFKPAHKPQKYYRKEMLHSKNILIHGTLLFRKKILKKLKAYNPLLTSGDTEFLLRATRYFNFDNLPEILIKRRLHPGSITHTFGKRLRKFVHPILKHREYLWTKKQIQQAPSKVKNTNAEPTLIKKGMPPLGNKPLISIVMASHNCEHYIAQAVESVLSQTYKHFEFIIVDDASTDQTLHKLTQYTDSRLTLLQRTECSCSGNTARNDALQLATGDFIAIADADDINEPHRLEKQITYFYAHPSCDFLGGGIMPIDRYGLPSGPPEFKPSYKDQKKYRKALLSSRNIILHPTLMFRKPALHRLGPYNDFASSADYEYFLRASRYFTFHNLQEVLVQYRRHGTSVTQTYGKAISHHHHMLFLSREYVWIQKQIETTHPHLQLKT